MSFKQRIGRNEPCLCGSGKKFKKCCVHRVEQLEKERLEKIKESYIKGHPIENVHIQYISDWFLKQPEYAEFNVIDITNILTSENYRTIQTEHYSNAHGHTIILAYRNAQNEKVFIKRSPQYTNIMVMFRGAYQVFSDFSFGNITHQLKKMIDIRINEKDYTFDNDANNPNNPPK